jgi:hypothetical protein
VARALVDSERPPHGARLDALQGRALVDVRGSDDRSSDADLQVALGVGRGAVETFSTILGGGPWRELQDGSSLLNGLAADEVDDQSALRGLTRT